MPESLPAKINIGCISVQYGAEVLNTAAQIATPLAKLIEEQKLYVNLKGKRHVKVEGWTTLIAMLGCTPREVSVTEHNGVYTAIVEIVRMTDELIISRASAECGFTDEAWSNSPRYARRSMAITRAVGKACRLAFSWIIVLAGFNPTPAEEMSDSDSSEPELADQHKAFLSRLYERAKATDNLSAALVTIEERFPSPELCAKAKDYFITLDLSGENQVERVVG